jgi:DNA-binding GntR family transcriptional regulator
MDNKDGKTLSQTISNQLAEEIVLRHILPGARMDEQSIATRFGVSRSPVRDALRQLAATRLVEYLPRRGFSAAAVKPADLDGLFEASGEIEALCASLCALRAGPAERKRIEFLHARAAVAVSAGDAKTYAELNEEFHNLIYAGAHNKTLGEVALSLRQRLAPFRARSFFVVDKRLQNSHAEHDALVKCLLAQDGEAAAQAMRNHAANSTMNVLQHFDNDVGQSGRRTIV